MQSRFIFSIFLFFGIHCFPFLVFAKEKSISAKKNSGEELFQTIRDSSSNPKEKNNLFSELLKPIVGLDWKKASQEKVFGNLRFFTQKKGDKEERLFLVRSKKGKIFVLSVPKMNAEELQKSHYHDLIKAIQFKMQFSLSVIQKSVLGKEVSFARLRSKPKRDLLDRLFFLLIVFVLFLVMVGMGLTLTQADFARVFSEPKAMVVGPICQFGFLPLVAFLLGHVMGFSIHHPYIFAGLILIASSPGGVTSNLMTYLGKGDLALSVSLTALSTVLSVVMTPLLLALYVTNIPHVSIPLVDIAKQITVLVIVPLFIGMAIRSQTKTFHEKSKPFFDFLGVFSILFLIVVGIVSNLDKFADTDRYGFRFYATVFLVTFIGMSLGTLIPKLAKLKNVQIRAIALETGLQNGSLAMTISFLLQDRMGDFYSSMFFTAGIFTLWMYVAGGIFLALYPKILPLEE